MLKIGILILCVMAAQHAPGQLTSTSVILNGPQDAINLTIKDNAQLITPKEKLAIEVFAKSIIGAFDYQAKNSTLTTESLYAIGILLQSEDALFPARAKEFSPSWEWSSVDLTQSYIQPLSQEEPLQEGGVLNRKRNIFRDENPDSIYYQLHLLSQDISGCQRRTSYLFAKPPRSASEDSPLHFIGSAMSVAKNEKVPINPSSPIFQSVVKTHPPKQIPVREYLVIGAIVLIVTLLVSLIYHKSDKAR